MLKTLQMQTLRNLSQGTVQADDKMPKLSRNRSLQVHRYELKSELSEVTGKGKERIPHEDKQKRTQEEQQR